MINFHFKKRNNLYCLFQIRVKDDFLVASDSCVIGVTSLGYSDIGCDITRAADCAFITINGVEFKPFENSPFDGAERGLVMLTIDRGMFRCGRCYIIQ